MPTTLKQHYMIGLKEGGNHPIFSLTFLPENLASLVETILLSTEYLFVLFFITNLFINLYDRFALKFVPTLLINGFGNQFFATFGQQNTALNNLIAILATIIIYDLSYRYFEFVKFNLHPRDGATELRLKPIQNVDREFKLDLSRLMGVKAVIIKWFNDNTAKANKIAKG